MAGRKIELIVKDDEGKPDVAVTRARELIEKDGVEILTGLQSSSVALAAMAVPAEYEKVLVVTTAAADQITGANFNKYTFRTGSCAYQDALAGAKFAARELGKRFVYFAPDMAWGEDQIKAWKTLVEAEGATSVAEIKAPMDTTDFTPYLQQVLGAQDDAVFVPHTRLQCARAAAQRCAAPGGRSRLLWDPGATAGRGEGRLESLPHRVR